MKKTARTSTDNFYIYFYTKKSYVQQINILTLFTCFAFKFPLAKLDSRPQNVVIFMSDVKREHLCSRHKMSLEFKAHHKIGQLNHTRQKTHTNRRTCLAQVFVLF